ncbi:MAG: Stp1/IreP family PP2C-type Ser/Thr phosphatase [Actinobacteria bacterium]|nr:Stp1/IreP family PP2C-type Ser/Thr phosphatase [Actinomycetota bacterium]
MRIGRAAGVTDTGRRRLRNEDAFICEPPLFAVADGMGGARAGEIAAGLAAAALEEADAETRGARGVEALIVEANRRIWERALEDPATAGMGTTVTAALVDAAAGTVAIGHVGDSRAYRLRNGVLEQLTTDHSLVAELVESGILTPEEAEHHPQRSAITRALGTEPSVEVDAFTVDARPGDVFLICSDGLSAMVDDKEVASVVEGAERDVARAAEALVATANAHGGEDNVTVVLFDIAAESSDGAVGAAAQPVAEEPAVAETATGDTTADPHVVAEPEQEDAPSEAGASLRRHGAGPGGRLAAILFILAVLALGALALYWGVVH